MPVFPDRPGGRNLLLFFQCGLPGVAGVERQGGGLRSTFDAATGLVWPRATAILCACQPRLDGKAMSNLDAIIVGAGHNGLTCAAYLGMAGLRVRVFERRDVVGGACVTEEFHPGFRNSTAAYTVSLLQPKVIEDLKLHERGLRLVERRAQNFLPLPDGRYLLTGNGRTEREIAKFSAKDAARYPAYRPRSAA